MSERIVLPPDDHYRIYGSLPASAIEAVLVELGDAREVAINVDSADTHIREAMSPIGEDFLSQVLTDLRALGKKARGNTKEEINRIVGVLEGIEQTAKQALEYSDYELKQAIDALAGDSGVG